MTAPPSSADAIAPCRKRGDDDGAPEEEAAAAGSTDGGGGGAPAGNSPPLGRRRSTGAAARRGPAPWGRSPGETRWTRERGTRQGTGAASRSPVEHSESAAGARGRRALCLQKQEAMKS